MVAAGRRVLAAELVLHVQTAAALGGDVSGHADGARGAVEARPDLQAVLHDRPAVRLLRVLPLPSWHEADVLLVDVIPALPEVLQFPWILAGELVVALQIFSLVRALRPRLPACAHLSADVLAASLALALADEVLARLRHILEVLYVVTVARLLEESLLHSIHAMRVVGVGGAVVAVQARLAFAELRSAGQVIATYSFFDFLGDRLVEMKLFCWLYLVEWPTFSDGLGL